MESVHAKRMLGVSMLATWKEALNWFFREGQKPSVSVPIATTRRPPPSGEVMSDVPPTAAADLGATEWEQRLIRELRSRHYQWRTEQTYRGWAHRFATNEHIRDFLSDLATRQRVSASTQKQALNALVFVLREALARDPGEFGDFTRARKPVRMPDVLTRDECQRLFAALEGTPRLMAELMYGSGVRLLELLRLRVKDMVDRAVGFRLSAIG
jgi:integrase